MQSSIMCRIFLAFPKETKNFLFGETNKTVNDFAKKFQQKSYFLEKILFQIRTKKDNNLKRWIVSIIFLLLFHIK